MGPDAYLEDAAGGRPFSIAEWEPNNRILFDAGMTSGPIMSTGTSRIRPNGVPDRFDPAARFALLASEQVDAVYNLPWALAKDLDKSEDLGVRA